MTCHHHTRPFNQWSVSVTIGHNLFQLIRNRSVFPRTLIKQKFDLPSKRILPSESCDPASWIAVTPSNSRECAPLIWHDQPWAGSSRFSWGSRLYLWINCWWAVISRKVAGSEAQADFFPFDYWPGTNSQTVRYFSCFLRREFSLLALLSASFRCAITPVFKKGRLHLSSAPILSNFSLFAWISHTSASMQTLLRHPINVDCSQL